MIVAIWLPLIVHVTLLSAQEPAEERFPLGDQLKVLADDVASPAYRRLVEGMNGPDLDAEWRRVETLDSSQKFLARHGGKEKVLANPELAQAFARRAQIEEKFLLLMRDGFRRLNKPAPFDQGVAAEAAGTRRNDLGQASLRLSYVLPSTDADKYWPRFRGPTGQGQAGGDPLPVRWDTQTNVVWKTTIPGDGNSSPVIWGERIFLTSSGPDGVHRTVHCLARDNGRILWSREIPAHSVEPQVRDKNGFASSTPVVDGQRVIAYFGGGGLVAYDFSGRLLWHYPTPDFDSMWGSAASPLLYEDRVILIHDQNRGKSLCLALDKTTGKLLWQAERAKAMGWATPVVVRVADHDELLYAGGETLKGYDPQTGKELWTLDGPTREVVPTVVIGRDLIYSASGRQGPTLGVRPGGQGNVSESHLAWRTVRGGPHVPSPLYIQDRLFVINDFGIAQCLDANTGDHVWQTRLEDKFSASGIEAAGLLYFCAESGMTYVLRAKDEFELVAQNDLGEPILASPAALDGQLFIRAGDALYCIGGK